MRWFLLFAATVLVLRAGRYPAALTGDEIWFAEAAFQLLETGVPRRLIHPDAVMSATADFLPPIIMLVQALGQAVFGLTAFAIGLQSVLVPLAGVALVAALARRLGADPRVALLAGASLLASQLFLRAGLYVRYESLSAVLLLAAILWRSGALVCLAGLAYYPLAPFVGLAWLCLVRPGWRQVAGFAVPALAFGLYVAAFPDAFRMQVLENGGQNYGTFDLIRRPLDPALWSSARETIPEVAGLALLIPLALFAGPHRRLALAIAILAVPALLYPFQARLLAPAACLALVLLALWLGRLMWVGAAAAVAVLALIAGTTLWQWEGRRYPAEAIRAAVPPGLVGIDQRAWLALRADRDLRHVMPVWAPPQVTVFRPLDLDRVQVLVLSTGDAEATIAANPGIAGKPWAPVARINPPFASLPWARQAPYDLTVFALR